MEAFEEDYEIFLRTHDLKGLRASYAELLVNQDREVCVLDPKGEYRGIARGINDQGELLVERPDGTVEEGTAFSGMAEGRTDSRMERPE